MACWYSYPRHLPWAAAGDRGPQVGQTSTDQPPPLVCYDSAITYKSQVHEKFFSRVLKSSLQELWEKIFLKIYVIIFRFYTWIMQTPDLHFLGSKWFE